MVAPGEELWRAALAATPAGPRERMLVWRRYGFGIALVVAVGACALLFWALERPEPPKLSEAELAALATARPPARESAGPLPVGAAPVAGKTALTVVTSPPGATVLVDLDSIGVTPLTLDGFDPGVYVLTVSKPEYTTLDTIVYAEPGQQLRLALLLDRDLSVFPIQPEAAPLEADFAEPLPSASEPFASSPVAPSPADPPVVSLPRRTAGPATGMLLVTSEPAGASVYLGEQLVGVTPLVYKEAPPGRHQLSLRREGFGSYTTEVEIEAGQAATVTGRLSDLMGTLTILVKPWGSIYIDDKLHKRDTDVKYSVRLPVGRHRVKAVHPTLGTWENVVELSGGSPQQVAIYFNPSTPAAGAVREEPPAAPAKQPEAGQANRLLGDDGVYVAAEAPPLLVGGLERLHRMASYPEAAFKAGLEGRVYLRFVVTEQGRVTDAEVVRGIGMGCDEEALRVIRRARFEPGKVGGKPVRVWHALYINFQIPD